MLKSTKKSTTRTQRLNLATLRTKVEDFTSMLRTASNFFVRQLHQVNGDDTLRWLRWQTHAWNQLLRKLSNTNVNGESLVPLDFVRELLKVQEDTIFFSTFIDSTNNAIDNLLKEFRDLKNSLVHSRASLSTLWLSRLHELQGDVQFLLDKADDLENCSRRNYLFFEGIPKQGTNETWDQPEPKIKQLISDKLE